MAGLLTRMEIHSETVDELTVCSDESSDIHNHRTDVILLFFLYTVAKTKNQVTVHNRVKVRFV